MADPRPIRRPFRRRGASRARFRAPALTLAAVLAAPLLPALAAGLVVAPGPAAAQSAERSGDRGAAAGAAIRGVISRQLDAFRAGDLEGAWRFASPGIQDAFRSPENFGRMVREGYPMVWDARRRDFAALEAQDGRLRQTVVITGPDGAVHVADYFMVERDGAWRIDGVRLRPRVGAGA